MKARVQSSTLLAAGPKRVRHVAHLDEDETTLAFEAARLVLAAAGVEASRVARLEVTSTTGRGWGPALQAALGLRAAQLVDLEAKPAPPTPPEDATVLRIRSEAPRAQHPGKDATAEAEIRGPGIPSTEVTAFASTPRKVDAATWDRIRRWNEEAPRAVPMGAYVPRATWDASIDARARLLASICDSCGASHHPPLDPCGRCGRPTRMAAMQGPGTLYTFTSIAKGAGPTEFDPTQDVEGEYLVGILEYANGIRLAGMLTQVDAATVAIGQTYEPVFRRLYAQEGAWRYGLKFRPSTTRPAP